jgi:hypothetical protein
MKSCSQTHSTEDIDCEALSNARWLDFFLNHSRLGIVILVLKMRVASARVTRSSFVGLPFTNTVVGISETIWLFQSCVPLFLYSFPPPGGVVGHRSCRCDVYYLMVFIIGMDQSREDGQLSRFEFVTSRKITSESIKSSLGAAGIARSRAYGRGTDAGLKQLCPGVCPCAESRDIVRQVAKRISFDK